MSEHTAGPFSVESPMDDGLWIVEAGKQAYQWRVIATLPFPDERGDIPRTQVIANARLFAASDVMLEALRGILPGKLCGEGWNLPDDELVQIMVTFADLRAARAAIAAATGEV